MRACGCFAGDRLGAVLAELGRLALAIRIGPGAARAVEAVLLVDLEQRAKAIADAHLEHAALDGLVNGIKPCSTFVAMHLLGRLPLRRSHRPRSARLRAPRAAPELCLRPARMLTRSVAIHVDLAPESTPSKRRRSGSLSPQATDPCPCPHALRPVYCARHGRIRARTHKGRQFDPPVARRRFVLGDYGGPCAQRTKHCLAPGGRSGENTFSAGNSFA